jgi:uncharacterized DUF497 family protein
MRFRRDRSKAAINPKKHGVSLTDAETVLEDPLAITVEDPDAEGEHGYVTIGLGSAGELLLVIWTDRDDERRVISARRSTRRERDQYEK